MGPTDTQGMPVLYKDNFKSKQVQNKEFLWDLGIIQRKYLALLRNPKLRNLGCTVALMHSTEFYIY